MNEVIEKIENHLKSNTIARSVTATVITAGFVIVVVFGNINLTIGG